MTLTNGNLETGGNLVLRSNVAGTASVAQVINGSVSGNVTANRYIAGGATHWRFMCTPVGGQQIAHWNDDFLTSGFIGSDFPDWPSAANPWPSIQYYDEANGTTYEDGYTPVTGTNMSMSIGQGFWVWSGDSAGGTSAFIVDVTGPLHIGDFNYSLSYNNDGGPNDNGWNLLGNPYASVIDWDSPNWTKSNINATVYIWNPNPPAIRNLCSRTITRNGNWNQWWLKVYCRSSSVYDTI